MPDERDTITHPDLGDAKVALQRAGLLDLEREIDDELDPETWTALFAYAQSEGIEWSLEAFEDEDGVIPQAVLDALLSTDDGLAFNEPEEELIFDDYPDFGVSFGDDDALDLSAVEVFDVTGEHELKKGKRWPRGVEQITTIMLHQTAVKFGTTRSARNKYGERGALHRRFHDVACHAAALMNGDVLLVNGWRRYVYHGNSANRFSIGIEIEGLYAGVADDRRTVWGKKEPHTLTQRTTAAARKAVQLAVEQARELGCPITKLVAHRNYASSRISDPGEEIWREVALWAVDALDLTIDYELAKKGGRAIPRDWDPAGTVDYRGRGLK